MVLKNEDINLLIKMENLIGMNEKRLFGKNKDKKCTVNWYDNTTTTDVNIDDHDLDIGAGGKLPHVGQLGRIIDKVSAGRIVIERRKMLLRCLQGFIHALADGYAGHNNDKLGKTIKAV